MPHRADETRPGDHAIEETNWTQEKQKNPPG